jgi:DNA-binding CsgD family transcriptional regulator
VVTEVAVTLEDVALGVAAGLITIDGERVAFAHPLARSAVRQAAGVDDRVAVHRALACVLVDQPERAIWHRAAAAVGADDDLADELEGFARRTRHRGAPAGAQTALERSADLTSDPLRRAARLLSASEIAYEMGSRDDVDRLLRVAEHLDVRPHSRARSMWIRERFDEGFSGGTFGIADLARTAVETRRLGDQTLALNLLASAANRCWWANPAPGDRDAVLDAFDQIDASESDPLFVAALAWAAPVERERQLFARLHSVPPSPYLEPAAARLLGAAAICLGDHTLAERYLDVAIDGLRRDGRLAWLAQSLLLRAWNSIHLTHLDDALSDASEGERLARESGQNMWAARGLAAHAMVAGLRGQVDVAAELSGRAERVAYPKAVSSVIADVHLARGVTSLCNRQYTDAYHHFERMHDPAGPAFHSVKRYWYLGDFAEAAVRSGNRDHATEIIDRLPVDVDATQSPHIISAFRHATAVLANDATADAAFQRAIRSTPSTLPYERARLQLAYGGWLRRRRRIAESRTPLRASLATFDALGAISWGQQARDELRASGEASRSRPPDALDRLTPQELQIARLVAEGLTNQEIGHRLYLSPRTIGSHLYRIFPKLGVTTRGQLASELDALNLRHDG